MKSPKSFGLKWYQSGCCNLAFKHWHDMAAMPVSPLDKRVKDYENAKRDNLSVRAS